MPRIPRTLAPSAVAVGGSVLLVAAALAAPVRLEEGYHRFASPRRTAGEIAAIRAELPAGSFTLPPTDWTRLPRTRAALTGGGTLRLIAVGDSIVNDVMRSGWVRDLRAERPRCEIDATVLVRGCGGCQHYREADRVERYVLSAEPDLVILGGISQDGVGPIRDVIDQLRAARPEIEILLTTGLFGTADPRDPAALAAAGYSGTGEYGRKLRRLADRRGCAYLDMTTPWAAAIRSTGRPPRRFYRDPVHANERGEQIAGAILAAFFAGGGDRDLPGRGS